MAEIIFTMTDENKTRVVNGIADRLRYSPTLDDGNDTPNPENKGQFVKRKLKEHIIKLVREAEYEQAKNQAVDIVDASLEDLTVE